MRTARLLRRTGFGATGAEIDAVTDPAAYIRSALSGDPNADPGAVRTPMPRFDPPVPPAKGAGVDARRRYRAQAQAQVQTLTTWWLRRMAAVRNPVREKLTLLWHNHFATSAVKVVSAPELGAQNQTLRSGAAGDFGALAYAMLTDPAMLRWLDGVANTAKAPNENLAREFMELFALGHGNGYTESDVREGARALTGWTIGKSGATLVPARHDPRPKTVLGVTGPLGVREFCDAVLNRPESAGYVTGRLWRGLASDDPPSAATAQRIAAAYGPRRDLSALVTAIVSDEEFVSARDTVVHGPVEWAVGVVRALRIPLDDPQARALSVLLRSLGQLPFHPPDVGGWPSGQAWMSTAAAELRLTAMTTMARKVDLSPISSVGRGERVETAAHLLGVGNWSDRSAKVLTGLTADPATLIAVAVNTPEYLTS